MKIDKKLIIEVLKKERAKEEAIRKRNEYLLEECLQQSYYAYKKDWSRASEALGKEEDCDLPSSTSERLNRLFKERRDECFRKYPIDWIWYIDRPGGFTLELSTIVRILPIFNTTNTIFNSITPVSKRFY